MCSPGAWPCSKRTGRPPADRLKTRWIVIVVDNHLVNTIMYLYNCIYIHIYMCVCPEFYVGIHETSMQWKSKIKCIFFWSVGSFIYLAPSLLIIISLFLLRSCWVFKSFKRGRGGLSFWLLPILCGKRSARISGLDISHAMRNLSLVILH